MSITYKLDGYTINHKIGYIIVVNDLGYILESATQDYCQFRVEFRDLNRYYSMTIQTPIIRIHEWMEVLTPFNVMAGNGKIHTCLNCQQLRYIF